MIWRLTYCNKKGVEARIDIIRGNRTPIEIVQGSGQPFTLAYKLDKNDKSGYIMTSSADIEIFETETFNIDDLKTSNETELKVEYFEDNVLTWSGFILPDFFSREIGSPNIVRMTASDRLTALKGVALSNLPSRVALSDLIELSLAQTGLSLTLVSQVQINQGLTNILDSEILSQRLTDVKGRSISCYDILMSIMVGTNSTIRQRKGQWQIYNKLEHELKTPTIFFDKVERGAIRTIQPVASSVGVFNEFGGNRLHPNNYDFSLGLANWTSRNGFEAYIDNRVVSSFLGGTPIYEMDVTTKDYLVNFNNWITNETNLDTAPFLESNNIPIASTQNNTVEVEVDISAVMAEKLSSNTAISFLRYAIIATDGVDTYALTTNGLFEAYDPEKINEHSIILAGGQQPPLLLASPAHTNSSKRKGVLEVNNVNDFHINIRIYGSSFEQYVNVNFASVRFGNKTETPKGNLYKTTQGSNYTKLHDIETVIFGDYIRNGLNGYFYNYPIDDTSNLYLPSGTLSLPEWVTAFDTTERPLLHHISRQKSSLFSVAHDILKANINVESFDPLAIFQDCKGGKYIVVSASFDFLRSEVNVELEQIAYDNTILKRDYIYSYFGEGEDTIKSIGGIAGGGGGTGGGGGMTSEQLEMLTSLADWWRLDEENDAIYSEKSVYSLKNVSALGLGSEGGGGGGDFDRLDAWVDYNETKANWVLSALLGYDLHTRVNSLEAGGGASNIEIAITGSGNAVTGVSKSGNTLTFAKSSTFALSTHNHTIANITGLQNALDGKEPSFTKNTAFNKNFGTVAGTVMQGNDSRVHSHANKPILDQITQSNIDVLAKLSIVDGNIKVDTTLWATGGISALGLGSGGGSGGGGVDMLDSWANYTTAKANYYVPASLLVPFRNDTLSRLTSLESGSATSIVNTGSGNAITSLTKSGSVITADKGLTFALSTHTHTIAQITGLQGALDLKATQSDITTAINGIEIGGRNLILNSNVKKESGLYLISEYDLSADLIDGQKYTVTVYADLPEGRFPTIAGTPAAVIYRELIKKDVGVYTGTFTYNTNPTYPNNLTNKIAVYNSPNNAMFGGYISKIKLEKSTIATDWSLAPEDTQAKFDSKLNLTGGTLSGNLLFSNSVSNIRLSTGNEGNAYIGSSGLGTPPSGEQDYGVYISSNAYRDTNGKWYHGRTDTINAYRFKAGRHNHFLWSYSPNVGAGEITFIDLMSLRSNGNLGIGTTNPLYRLDVTGTGRFTGNVTASAGINTPKVDFGNGFTIEPSGTELVFKYNGVIKQRMLSTGTILGTGGITALATN
jgi:hypothetical protein